MIPKYVVYGRKSAVQFMPDVNANSKAVIGIEAAAHKDGGKRTEFCWDDKLYMQLTPREVPVFTSVLLGFRAECRFEGRGETGKGLFLSWQLVDNNSNLKRIYLKLWQGTNRQYHVQIGKDDLFFITALALHQCRVLIDSDMALTLAALKSSSFSF